MSFKRPLNQAMREVGMMLVILQRYENRKMLEDVIRRGQQTVGGDGYPASSLGDGSSATASDGSSTERAALVDAKPEAQDGKQSQRDTWESTSRDNIGDALREGLSGLTEAFRILSTVDQRLQFALGAGSKIEGRVNTIELCAACNEPAPKVRRVDGQPYCATTCYHKVKRSA